MSTPSDAPSSGEISDQGSLPSSPSFQSGVLQNRGSADPNEDDTTTNTREPLPPIPASPLSVRERIAQFGGSFEPATRPYYMDDDIDRATTVDSDIDRCTTADSQEEKTTMPVKSILDEPESSSSSDLPGLPSLEARDTTSTIAAAEDVSGAEESVSQPTVAAASPPDVKPAPKPATSVAADSPATGGSSQPPDTDVAQHATKAAVADQSAQGLNPTLSQLSADDSASTTNAFDIALSRSAGYVPPEHNNEEGGRLWTAASTATEASPSREDWIADAIQPPSVPETKKVQVDTVDRTPSALDCGVFTESQTSSNAAQINPFDVSTSPSEDFTSPPSEGLADQNRSLLDVPSKSSDATSVTGNNPFDVAMARSQDYTSPPNDGEGGRLWDTAKRVSTPPRETGTSSPLPAVAQSRSIPQAQSQVSEAESSAVTENNPFDVALSKSHDYKTPPEEDGGRLWESAGEVASRASSPVPAVAQSRSIVQVQSHTSEAASSTVTENNPFDVALSRSQNYETPPNEGDGGRLWDSAGEAASRASSPVPAVAQSRSIVQAQSHASEAASSTVTDNNPFDVALSKSHNYEAPPNEGDGGRLWDSAGEAASRASSPVPAVAQNRSIVQAQSHASEAASSTITENNPFDIALSKSQDYRAPSNEEDGGRLWDSAGKAASRANSPVPAVAQSRSIVQAQSHTSEAASSTVTDNNPFDVALSKSQNYEAPPNEGDGGRLWDSAGEAASRASSPVPAVAQSRSIVQVQSHTSEAASSTVTDNNPFDVALSKSQNYEAPPNEGDGGRLWDSAGEAASRPSSPVPAVAQSRSIVQVQSHTSEAASSTVTENNPFDVALSKSQNYEAPPNEGDGGRLWDSAGEAASRPSSPVPAVAQSRSIVQAQSHASEAASSTVTDNNPFDVALSKSQNYEAPPNEEDGGRLWESAGEAASRASSPVPAVAQSRSIVQAQSHTSEAASSTVTENNPFDVALSRSQDYKAPPNEGDGGRLWDSAGEAASRANSPVPAVAQSRSIVQAQSHTSEAASSTVTENNPFDVALSRSQNYESPPNEGDGGRLWDSAAKVAANAIAPSTVDNSPLPSVAKSRSVLDRQSQSSSSGDTARPQDDGRTGEKKGTVEAAAAASQAEPKPERYENEPARTDQPDESTSVAEKRKQGNTATSHVEAELVKNESGGEPSLLPDRRERAVVPLKASSVPESDADESSKNIDGADVVAKVTEILRIATQEGEVFNDGPMVETSDDSSERPGADDAPIMAYSAGGSSRPRAQADFPSSSSDSDSSLTGTAEGSAWARLRAPTPDKRRPKDSNPPETFEDEGGPAWAKAGKGDSPSGVGRRLAQAIKEQSKLRAEARAISKDFTKRAFSCGAEPMEGEFYPLKSTKAARLRRHMVQLLLVGCFVSLGGWMGNMFVNGSCYFASVPIEIGAYNSQFDLHYGLWRYSPPESALVGYRFCDAYGQAHADEAPVVARMFHLLSMAAGTFSLAIMWFYLVSGFASPKYWRAAVWVSALAAVLQLLTLVFFAGALCRENGCAWGVGSSVILVSAFSWFVLALEMRYHGKHITAAPDNDGGSSKYELSSVSSGSGSEKMISGAYKPPMFV